MSENLLKAPRISADPISLSEDTNLTLKENIGSAEINKITKNMSNF